MKTYMKLLPRKPAWWSRIDSVLLSTMCAVSVFWRKSCTDTARSRIEAMSVMTVAMSTEAPNLDFVSFSSRTTGNTMPTECEAKSEA